MTQAILTVVKESPEVLVFLSLAVGYLIGKIKIRGVGIGAAASWGNAFGYD